MYLVISCSAGGTHHLAFRYQPASSFPDLPQKTGSTLGLAPVQDERPDPLYVGLHDPYSGRFSYFKSTPELKEAIRQSLVQMLPPYGISVVSLPAWDWTPASLRDLNVDSALLVEIKRLWIEGKGSLLATDVRASARLLFHLGVKKEMKVFTRNIEVDKEMSMTRFTPEAAEEIVNQMLAEMFDAYFSKPY
jgi:hypothetical protein